LSKGESLGDKDISGTAKSKQEKLADKADDAVAKSKELKEEEKKIAALEEINKDVSKLVELKGGAPAAESASAVPVAKVKSAASAVPATPR